MLGTTGLGGLKGWKVERKDTVAIRIKGEVWSLKPPVRTGIILWVDLFLLPLPQHTATCREPERHAYPGEAAGLSSFRSTALSKPDSLFWNLGDW